MIIGAAETAKDIQRCFNGIVCFSQTVAINLDCAFIHYDLSSFDEFAERVKIALSFVDWLFLKR